MKKILVFTFLLALPSIVLAQNGATNYLETLNKKGYTKVEWTFKSQMLAAAKSLDACSKAKKNCNLIDPIKNQKAKAIKQVTLGWSFGVERNAVVQKNMAGFEKAVYANRENKLLSWIIIESVIKKYPGYSYGAMSSRMNDYIQHMESIEDDE